MQECTGVGCLLHRCQGDQGVVFVGGTNCSFWLLAWMCNWKSLGSCCSVMPPQNGTEDPGELCDPVLKWCCHSENLKTFLWQSSQRRVQLAQQTWLSQRLPSYRLLPSNLLRGFASIFNCLQSHGSFPSWFKLRLSVCWENNLIDHSFPHLSAN